MNLSHNIKVIINKKKSIALSLDLLLLFIFGVMFIPIDLGFSATFSQVILIFITPLILILIKRKITYYLFSNKILFFYFIILFPFSVFLSLFGERFGPLFTFLYFLYSFFISIYLLIKPKNSFWFSYYIFYFLLVWFFVNGLNHGFDPQGLNNFLPLSSRNYISSFFIFSSIYIYVSCLNYNKKIRFHPTIITLVVSFLSYGRSSIIASSLLLIIVFLYKFSNKQILYKLVLILLFILMMIIIYNFLAPFIINNTKFEQGLKSPRIEMNIAYMKNLSWLNLMIGYDYTKIPIISTYGGNPHNSYIDLHYDIGLGFILFILITIIYFLKGILSIKNKNIFIVGLSLVFLFRGFFDIIVFTGLFDFVFFYSILSINKNLSRMIYYE